MTTTEQPNVLTEYLHRESHPYERCAVCGERRCDTGPAFDGDTELAVCGRCFSNGWPQYRANPVSLPTDGLYLDGRRITNPAYDTAAYVVAWSMVALTNGSAR